MKRFLKGVLITIVIIISSLVFAITIVDKGGNFILQYQRSQREKENNEKAQAYFQYLKNDLQFSDDINEYDFSIHGPLDLKLKNSDITIESIYLGNNVDKVEVLKNHISPFYTRYLEKDYLLQEEATFLQIQKQLADRNIEWDYKENLKRVKLLKESIFETKQKEDTEKFVSYFKEKERKSFDYNAFMSEFEYQPVFDIYVSVSEANKKVTKELFKSASFKHAKFNVI